MRFCLLASPLIQFRFVVGPLVLDDDTKGFIPFPVYKHKRDRGEIMQEFCKPSDILFPEFLNTHAPEMDNLHSTFFTAAARIKFQKNTS